MLVFSLLIKADQFVRDKRKMARAKLTVALRTNSAGSGYSPSITVLKHVKVSPDSQTQSGGTSQSPIKSASPGHVCSTLFIPSFHTMS